MLIDLSVTLTEKTPVYPGDPAIKITPAGTFKENGYQDHFVGLGTHIGTHVDAPSHMIENGKNLSEFGIERFSGPGVLVGSFDINTVRSSIIVEGNIVLFATGMSRLYDEPAYFSDYPAMSTEVAKYLIDQKVRMVGVDACSVDNQKGFPIHKLLLGAEVLIIENLTNLDGLKGKKFNVHAHPINFALDGAPARVVAETR